MAFCEHKKDVALWYICMFVLHEVSLMKSGTKFSHVSVYVYMATCDNENWEESGEGNKKDGGRGKGRGG